MSKEKEILVITDPNALPSNTYIEETYGFVIGHTNKDILSDEYIGNKCKKQFSEANAVVGLVPEKSEFGRYIGTAVKVNGLKK